MSCTCGSIIGNQVVLCKAWPARNYCDALSRPVLTGAGTEASNQSLAACVAASDLQPKKKPVGRCRWFDALRFWIRRRLFLQMIVHGSHGIGVLQPWFAGCCSWYELLLESQVLKQIQKWWIIDLLFAWGPSVCMDHFNTKHHRGECCIEERF